MFQLTPSFNRLCRSILRFKFSIIYWIGNSSCSCLGNWEYSDEQRKNHRNECFCLTVGFELASLHRHLNIKW